MELDFINDLQDRYHRHHNRWYPFEPYPHPSDRRSSPWVREEQTWIYRPRQWKFLQTYLRFVCINVYRVRKKLGKVVLDASFYIFFDLSFIFFMRPFFLVSSSVKPLFLISSNTLLAIWLGWIEQEMSPKSADFFLSKDFFFGFLDHLQR